MSTAFLVITRYIEALFNAAPALAAGDIERSRERRVEPTSDAAIRIYPQNADGRAAAIQNGFHTWAFDISVECLVRAALTGADKHDAEAAADVLLQAVWQRIAEAQAPAGVHSLLNRPRVAWTFIEGERPLCAAIFTFSVDMSTHNQTLAAWS